MGFGSKFFGYLAAFGIVIGLGWVLLPEGWNTLIALYSPYFGNYVRPLAVMASLLLLNPLTNFLALGIWVGAGFVGGVIAGTKKGGFVVGFMAWVSCLVITGFSVYMLMVGGFNPLALPPVPPGYSLADLLSIPLVSDLLSTLLSVLGSFTGGGGGSIGILGIVAPFLVFVFAPVIAIIVGGIIGAIVRPKE
ncbi:MAG: hypothetical protein ACW99U_02075 [Candidatus Thorarchaeota archaeon]|jgi:hypothetical protein